MATSVRTRLTPLLSLLALLLSITAARAQDSTHTLLLTPDSLSFTSTKLGTPVVKTFTIKNQTSTLPIIISIGQPNNPLFIVESEHQFTLAKGQTKTVTVSFTTSIPGVFDAILPIENTALDAPSPIEYKLRGEAHASDADSLGLVISPDPVAFGIVTVGSSRLMSFTIRNASTGHRYTGTVKSPTGTGPRYTLEAGSGAFDLAPGQSQTVSARFAPTTVGYFIDSVMITASANDAARPDTAIRVILAGEGTTGPVPGDTMRLIALPDSLDLGERSTGLSTTHIIVIMNRSQSDTLTGVVNRPTTESYTLLSGGDFFKLNPGEARTLTVRYMPLSSGAHDDSIVVSYSTQDTAANSRGLTIRFHGTSSSSGVDRATLAGYLLGQNHPNPAVGSTTIDLTIARAGNVRLALHDVRGRLLRTLLDQRLDAGPHSLTIDAGTLEPGVYLYRMESGGAVITRPMTVVR
jgi:hypothetical protein